MSKLRFLSRQQINDAEWDRCVSEAYNTLIYGHSWYLDAVTNVPRPAKGRVPQWHWEGLVQLANDGVSYVAVMPVPLRRRWGQWVVYQPLFCQFVAIFAAQSVEPKTFLSALTARHRYASRLSLCLPTPVPNLPGWVQQSVRYTHTLPVIGAVTRYTPDRRMNLRRAYRRVGQTPGWAIRDTTDVQPLLTLFQENHAGQIGVGSWVYPLFKQLFNALQERRLSTLRYACVNSTPIAGALFADYAGRIIYLFNAANAEGRRLNARTLLLHEQFQNTATRSDSAGLLVDFESPDKPGIIQFYESFGAVPTPYLQLSWNRLTLPERCLLRLKTRWLQRMA